MQVISKFSKGFRFLFCVANVYSKYACAIPVIDKVITITKAFQKNVYKSKRKPNKINEIIARKNGIEVHSAHNEGKCVVVKRIIRTLKNKIYQYMTSISKHVYIDKLDDKVVKHYNTYHSTIKMKGVDVQSNIYIDSGKENNNKDPKFKIGDIVRTSKTNNIFAKCYVPNWLEEDFCY